MVLMMIAQLVAASAQSFFYPLATGVTTMYASDADRSIWTVGVAGGTPMGGCLAFLTANALVTAFGDDTQANLLKGWLLVFMLLSLMSGALLAVQHFMVPELPATAPSEAAALKIQQRSAAMIVGTAHQESLWQRSLAVIAELRPMISFEPATRTFMLLLASTSLHVSCNWSLSPVIVAIFSPAAPGNSTSSNATKAAAPSFSSEQYAALAGAIAQPFGVLVSFLIAKAIGLQFRKAIMGSITTAALLQFGLAAVIHISDPTTHRESSIIGLCLYVLSVGMSAGGLPLALEMLTEHAFPVDGEKVGFLCLVGVEALSFLLSSIILPPLLSQPIMVLLALVVVQLGGVSLLFPARPELKRFEFTQRQETANALPGAAVNGGLGPQLGVPSEHLD